MVSSSKILFYTEPVMNTDWMAMLKIGEGKDMKMIYAVGNSPSDAVMNMRSQLAPLIIETAYRLTEWRRNSYLKSGRSMPAETATAIKMLNAMAMLCKGADSARMINMLIKCRPYAVELMPKNECVLWRKMMALIKWAEFVTKKKEDVVQ